MFRGISFASQADPLAGAGGRAGDRLARVANADCGQGVRVGAEDWKRALCHDLRSVEGQHDDLQWGVSRWKGGRASDRRIHIAGGRILSDGRLAHGKPGTREGRSGHALSLRPFDGEFVLRCQWRATLGPTQPLRGAWSITMCRCRGADKEAALGPFEKRVKDAKSQVTARFAARKASLRSAKCLTTSLGKPRKCTRREFLPKKRNTATWCQRSSRTSLFSRGDSRSGQRLPSCTRSGRASSRTCVLMPASLRERDPQDANR